MEYKPVRYRKYTSTPFPTPSGKVELRSGYLETLGLSPLPVYREPLYLRERIIQVTHGWEQESNVNRLTFDEINDPISGFPQMTSIPVKVEKENTT